VIDESTDLPEGTEVELQLVKVTDAFADMARGDREELEEAIEEGFRDFENGDHIGAREFLAQLRAKDA
jgi:predicted DNA-binding antitoxin AbrB/MazE fold protein